MPIDFNDEDEWPVPPAEDPQDIFNDTGPYATPRRFKTARHDTYAPLEIDAVVCSLSANRFYRHWEDWQILTNRATQPHAPLLDRHGQLTWLGYCAQHDIVPMLNLMPATLRNQYRLAPYGYRYDVYSAAVLAALEDDTLRFSYCLDEQQTHPDPTFRYAAQQECAHLLVRIQWGLTLLPQLIVLVKEPTA